MSDELRFDSSSDDPFAELLQPKEQESGAAPKVDSVAVPESTTAAADVDAAAALFSTGGAAFDAFSEFVPSNSSVLNQDVYTASNNTSWDFGIGSSDGVLATAATAQPPIDNAESFRSAYAQNVEFTAVHWQPEVDQYTKSESATNANGDYSFSAGYGVSDELPVANGDIISEPLADYDYQVTFSFKSSSPSKPYDGNINSLSKPVEFHAPITDYRTVDKIGTASWETQPVNYTSTFTDNQASFNFKNGDTKSVPDFNSPNSNFNFSPSNFDETSVIGNYSNISTPQLSKINTNEPSIIYQAPASANSGSETNLSHQLDNEDIGSMDQEMRYQICALCRSLNDCDASFCKGCGKKLKPIQKASSDYQHPDFSDVASVKSNRSEPVKTSSFKQDLSYDTTPKFFYNQQESTSSSSSSVVPENQRQQHPLVAFGFGGKLMTMFVHTQSRFSVNDKTITKKAYSGMIHIRMTSKYLEKDLQWQSSKILFSGPLEKKKKKEILADLANYRFDADDEELLKNMIHGMINVDIFRFHTYLEQYRKPIDHSAFSIMPTKEHVDEDYVAIRGALLDIQTKRPLQVATDFGLWTEALILAKAQSEESFRDVVEKFLFAKYQASDPLCTVLASISGVHLSHESSSNLKTTWKENAALVCQCSSNSCLSLNAFGRMLIKNSLPMAGHVCFLTSGRHPGKSGDNEDFQLIGSVFPYSNQTQLLSSIGWTEYFEYAQQQQKSAFSLFHLYQFKLFKAAFLVDVGKMEEAAKYCQEIASFFQKMGKMDTCYLNPHLLESTRKFDQRLTTAGVSQTAKEARNWFPNLMQVFDRGLEKFVGEDTSSAKPTILNAYQPQGQVNYTGTSSNQAFSINNPTNTSNPLSLSSHVPVVQSIPTYTVSNTKTEFNISQQPETFVSAPRLGTFASPPEFKASTDVSSSNDLDDDFGLGNNSLKKDKMDPVAAVEPKKEESAKEKPKLERPRSVFDVLSGALSSLIGKDQNTTTTNSVKANLGEENTFRFDPVTKKWVSTNPSTESSRAVTPVIPPPPDTALTSRPPSAPPSTPIPGSLASSRASSPAPIGEAAGSNQGVVGVARRGNTRKSARSRYVDTFNPHTTDEILRAGSPSFLPTPASVNTGPIISGSANHAPNTNEENKQ